ncbi:hydrolyzes non-standard nucleotides such as XTP and dITP/ITP [Arthrobacter sp. Hiyo4]|nr:hydrolyzes non-standard nucleotides such as XTP and dITP/ITP [Arthrobacter sp. Hiyo4]
MSANAINAEPEVSPAPRLVLATHNKGKLRELRELLRGQVPGSTSTRRWWTPRRWVRPTSSKPV